MRKNSLPSSIKEKIIDRFGKRAKIKYSTDLKQVEITPQRSSEEDLIFDNYKFLADLFQTTRVSTVLMIDSGCDCHMYLSPSVDVDVTFIANEVQIGGK